MTVVQSARSQAPFIDALIWGYHWGQTNWAFSFPQTPQVYFQQFGYEAINNFAPFNATQQQGIQAAVSELQTFLPVSFFNPNPQVIFQFAQATHVDYGFQTNLLNNNYHVVGNRGSAEAAVPSPHYQNPGAAGDTWYFPQGYNNPLPGTFANAAGLLHEFGHALGLKHGHHTQPILNPQGQQIGTSPALPTQFDNQNYSIMTYRVYEGDDFQNQQEATDLASPNVDYPSNFMMLDIAALQHLYGANYGTNSRPGNTTYSWLANGSMQWTENGQTFTTSATQRNKIFSTLWDGGGYDVIDLRNHSSNAVIDLTPGGWMRFSDSQLSQLGVGKQAIGNVAHALQYNNDPRSFIEAVFTSGGNDQLFGNVRDNYLNGGAGGDYIDGRPGADQMVGGPGDDTYIVDNAGDNPAELANEGNDTVRTSITFDVPQNVEVLIMTGTGDINSTGTNQRDIIIGNAGKNTINGAGGFDVMQGGAGDDVYAVDNSMDAVIEAAGEGFDNVYSSVDFIIDAAQEIESAILTGAATVLRGDNSPNQLFGNDQINVIDGRGGTDYMLGQGGADIFQIGLEPGAVDVIGDFSKAQGDRIAFTGFNQATTFVNQASATSFEVRDTKGTQTLADDTVQTFILNDSYGSNSYTQGALLFNIDYYFG